MPRLSKASRQSFTKRCLSGPSGGLDALRGAFAALAQEGGVKFGEDGRLDLLVGADSGEDLAGELEILLRALELRVEAQRVFVGIDGLVEPQLGLEDVAAQIVIRGFVRHLLDGVVDLVERLAEALVVHELLRLGGEGGRGAAQFGEPRGGELFVVQARALARLRAVALTA